MFKKILIIILSLTFMAWYAFAGNVTTNLIDHISSWKFKLDNWLNTISQFNVSSELYSFRFKIWNNSFLVNDISNNSNNINITCKNGYISSIIGNSLWTWQQEFAIMSYIKVWVGLTWTIDISCKPIAQPARAVKDTDIDFVTIEQKNAFTEKFPVTAEGLSITTTDIQSKFTPKKNIDNQPSFTDIVYLQLDLIWDLSSSLINTKTGFDFKNLFKTDQDFKNYNTWLEKFGNYTTKKDFIDAMSWDITLKDVWVAQDVIKWLYKCANKDKCTNVITLQKDPTSKYETYSLDDLQKTLYLSWGNILDDSITYYNYLSWTCSNLSTITDAFLKKQTQNICTNILKTNVNDADEEDVENYNLGYALWQRVKNLQTLKANFATLKTGVNLLGVYNTYYELTNLNVWVYKLSHIKKAKKETDLTGQYETIRKIFTKEKKDIEDKKKVKDSDWKRKAKRKAMEKMFTPWTKLHEVAETVPELDVTEDVGTEEVGGKDLITLRWSTIVWDDIADIYSLGLWHHIGLFINNPTDTASFTIDLWSDYANKEIKLKFKVKVSEPDLFLFWRTVERNWDACSAGSLSADRINVYVNDVEKPKLCFNDWDKTYQRTMSNIQLDDNWKATIKFKSYTTASKEKADIKDITYKIVD